MLCVSLRNKDTHSSFCVIGCLKRCTCTTLQSMRYSAALYSLLGEELNDIVCASLMARKRWISSCTVERVRGCVRRLIRHGNIALGGRCMLLVKTLGDIPLSVAGQSISALKMCVSVWRKSGKQDYGKHSSGTASQRCENWMRFGRDRKTGFYGFRYMGGFVIR